MPETCGKTLRVIVSAALIVQLMGCGTILHPERRGQKAGRIDVTIAALDAVGLLFFIIPGVIAFAVDFNNGTIYLPKGEKGLLNLNDLEKIRFNAGVNPKASIEKILLEKTDLAVRLDRDDLEVFELKSIDGIAAMSVVRHK